MANLYLLVVRILDMLQNLQIERIQILQQEGATNRQTFSKTTVLLIQPLKKLNMR